MMIDVTPFNFLIDARLTLSQTFRHEKAKFESPSIQAQLDTPVFT
jgi:hypothetical protein